jgi:uncharacterized protein (TIGR02099 family)
MERLKRRWWARIVSVAAGIVIAGALISGIFQIAILVVPKFADDLAAYVGQVAGRPVGIGGVSLGWRGLSPRLDLSDITVYSQDGETPEISAERLRLGFSLVGLLQGERVPRRIALSGVQLAAFIDEHGHLSVRGLDTAGGLSPKQDWLANLDRFQDVALSDCAVRLEDARLPGSTWLFHLRSGLVERTAQGLSASASWQLPAEIGDRAEFAVEITGPLAQPESWSGRWSLNVEELNALPWLDAALAKNAHLAFRDTELRVQGPIAGGHLDGADLAIESAAVLGKRDSHEARVEGLQVAAHLVFAKLGWTAQISRLSLRGRDGEWTPTQGRIQIQDQADGAREIGIDADELILGDLAPLLPLFPVKFSPDWVAQLETVEGAVQGLVLRWQRGAAGQQYDLRAVLDDVGVEPSGKRPGVQGVSGELTMTGQGGQLHLQEAPVLLALPHVFAEPVPIDQLGADVSWQRTADGWQVRVPRFSWQLAGSQGQGDFELGVPQQAGSSPVLRLQANFSGPDVTRFKPYTPLTWGEHLRDWLQHAILAGKVSRGSLKIEGPLSDFPYAAKPGLFALDLDIGAGGLAYAPGWPAAEQVSARLEFRGNSLKIRADGGRIGGNRIERADATIADFHAAQLFIDGEARGDAERSYAFLRASPLATPLAALLTRTEASGDARLKLRLDIPLHDVQATQVDGTVIVDGAQLAVNELPEPIRNIRGELSFDRHGAVARGLGATIFDTPFTASLNHEKGVHRIDATFDFVPDAAGKGLSRFLPATIRPHLRGRSQWQAHLALGGPERQSLHLESDLSGLAFDLPAPLDKPAEETWPSSLDILSGDAFPLRLRAALADRLGLDLAFLKPADGGLSLRRVLLRLGPGPEPVAVEDAIVATGTVADLDLPRWVQMFTHHGPDPAATAGEAGLPFRADLNVGRLWARGSAVEGVRLTFDPEPQGWLAALSGNGAKGQVHYRRSDEPLIEANFDHLRLGHPDTPLKPEPAGASAAGAALDPAQLPLLNLSVGALSIGSASLGALEFSSARIASGQRIDRLQISGDQLALKLDGRWQRSQGRSEAQLDFDAQTPVFKELLRGLGFAANIDSKRSHFQGALSWPADAAGAEQGIAWDRAGGHIDLDFDEGTLRAVEPGAGRVLGLFNFYALPRRLTLDFRDVVSKGMAFDRIKGRFNLAGGEATTDDLDIKTPSLRMEMRGRVGLTRRDYDQRVNVYPDLSSGITIGALLLGGPAAGALALVAQEVLEGPLDQVSQFSYRVTGSWDDPQVERISSSEKAPASKPTQRNPAPRGVRS